jgi:hypothetical protein
MITEQLFSQETSFQVLKVHSWVGNWVADFKSRRAVETPANGGDFSDVKGRRRYGRRKPDAQPPVRAAVLARAAS